MKPVARRRWIVWGGSAVVAGALLALALRPAAVEVDVAEVTRGRLAATLDEEGETRVRDRYLVSAPVPGRVLRIELEPGDPVVAGETVLATFLGSDPAVLDPYDRAAVEARVAAARAGLAQARAERDRARAQLDFARSEEARLRRLLAEGVVAPARFEQAELGRRTAEEALAAAEQAASRAGNDLRAAEVPLLALRDAAGGDRRDALALRSPIDGVVLRRLRESEAVVPAGEPLLEVADPGKVEIVADYLSADAVAMRPGMKVEIGDWGGGRALSGRVRRVEPGGFMKVSALGVEEQRVNVVIDVDDPRQAWEALGDGYRVEVRVVIWEGMDVVKVPASALFRRGEAWAAFAVGEGRAVLKEVEVGHRGGLEAEVLTGLAPGDRVVVHPPDDLEPGARLAPRALHRL